MAFDDHSRVAFSQLHTDEKAAIAYHRPLGVKVVRVMTDNVLYREELAA